MSDMEFGEISESTEPVLGRKPSIIDRDHPLAVAFDKSDEAGGAEVRVATATPKLVVNFLRRYAKQENRGVRVKAFDDAVVFKATDKRKSSAPKDEK